LEQLDLEHIHFRYGRKPNTPYILQDVSLHLRSQKIIALVGESGSGKTTLGKLAVGLLATDSGVTQFNGQSLKDRKVFKQYRRAVQMVHQDPYASLNPTARVLDIIGGGLLQHRLATRKTVRARTLETLADVGLPATEEFLQRYPIQLSGGQRQRVSIGRAMALNPKIVVADESVSMLDVSMRVAMLDLMLGLRDSRGVGYLFITHDFGVVRYFAEGETVMVMYRGRIIESGMAEDVIAHPQHPYTALLLESAPVPDPVQNRARGVIPSAALKEDTGWLTRGCRFRGRCIRADAQCEDVEPVLSPEGASHQAACFHPG